MQQASRAFLKWRGCNRDEGKEIRIEHNLFQNGLKKVLQGQYIEAIDKKMPLIQDRSTDEIDNDSPTPRTYMTKVFRSRTNNIR